MAFIGLHTVKDVTKMTDNLPLVETKERKE